MILNIDSTHSSTVLVTVNGATFPMHPGDKMQLTFCAPSSWRNAINPKPKRRPIRGGG
jgi:hypothetical protein